MTIQIERITQRTNAHERRCCVPECAAAAIWRLIDRDMPKAYAVDMGERLCCTAHIASAYVSLRGAHLIARSATAELVRLPGRAEQHRFAEPHAVGAGAGDR